MKNFKIADKKKKVNENKKDNKYIRKELLK